MLTVNKKIWYDSQRDCIEGVCLSTDNKPTARIANGSTLLEIDTGDIYMFDEDGATWRKVGA